MPQFCRGGRKAELQLSLLSTKLSASLHRAESEILIIQPSDETATLFRCLKGNLLLK